MITEPYTPLGVVPIFVNAGASVAPMIIGPLAAFFAILLKPKELLALFRRKPWLPVAILAIGVGVWFLGARAFSSPAQAARQTAAPQEDWNAFALKKIKEAEEAAKKRGIRWVWDYSPDSQGGAMVLSSPAYSATANRVFCTAAVQDVASFFGVIYCVDGNVSAPGTGCAPPCSRTGTRTR